MRLFDCVRADVGGHDYDGVFEVDLSAVRIFQMSVVEHLEQDVEHVGVRLFYFVEQDDGIRVSAHFFRKLAALVVTDVAGRGADEFGHVHLIHIFGHIHAYHQIFVAEHCLRQRFGKLGFAHARRSQEDERADGTALVLNARAGTAYRPCHRGHRFVLTHDALAQFVFQPEQPLRLLFRKLCHGNGRAFGHDFRNILFVHEQFLLCPVLSPVLLFLRDFRFELFYLGVEFRARLEVAPFHVVVEVDIQFADLFFLVLYALRKHEVGHLLPRHCLVHQVDGFIGQEAVGDVPVGEYRRRFQGGVRYLHAVVLFVFAAQSLQDDFRFVHRGRFNHNGLQSAFQRRVLFDILGVFVYGGGAYRLQLAPCQHGL